MWLANALDRWFNKATHLLLFPDPDGSVVGAGRDYLAVLRRPPDNLHESARIRGEGEEPTYSINTRVMSSERLADNPFSLVVQVEYFQSLIRRNGRHAPAVEI